MKLFDTSCSLSQTSEHGSCP